MMSLFRYPLCASRHAAGIEHPPRLVTKLGITLVCFLPFLMSGVRVVFRMLIIGKTIVYHDSHSVVFLEVE